MKFFSSLFLSLILTLVATVSAAKDLPKIAVWDLNSGNINPSYAQDLTSILVSEINKLEKYEVYSQENVRTLAGWTAERMHLGCTDTKCLTALGQMDIAKLISGRVGKIGNRYSVSLNIFDTQNARAEKSVSEVGRSEDELIDLVQVAVRKLLGEEMISAPPPAQAKMVPPPPSPPSTMPSQPQTTLQQATTPETWKDSVTGMEFVFIKGGCFEMGDTFGDRGADEKPVHEVCVSDFYLGKYEVTQGQWKKMMGSNPPYFKASDESPVESVSWNDAQQFIDRLNSQTGRKYRLPTEAEWEYAARSGGKREKFPGKGPEEELDQYAWYENNSASKTHQVGQKNPNGLGLYDMSGNVCEWCADRYDEDYYKNSPKNNPKGPDNRNFRVLRGGSWANYPRYVRAATRAGGDPASRDSSYGFRLGVSTR